jgi:phosphoribosylanthranilate isomerase
MLTTKVKASEIANLTDARYFAALEVEWLCFNLEQGAESYIEPQSVMAIKEWVEGPKIVGTFGMQSTEYIQQAISTIGLDAIQLGHFVPISQIMMLRDTPIIKEVFIGDQLNMDEIGEHIFMHSAYISAFSLRGSVTWASIKNNSLQVDFLKKICADYDIIIDFEFKAEEVNELLHTISPLGINVKGGEEEAVGVKSFEEMDDLFENIIIEN